MTIRARARLRTLAVLGTATLGLTGLATFQANRAFADPTEVYVATGSDTTMDVIDQFGIDLTGNEVGSYDAVNPVTAAAHELITPVKAGTGIRCSFTRPNGSGEGLSALRKSINQSTTASQLTAPPQAGCIDFSRSSSAPATTDASPTGALVYIPFALDAVTGATGPSGSTAITTADSFTVADLVNLYKNCTTVTEGGVTYNPGTAGAGQTQINLYIPQSGSGTFKFWATTLGIPTSPLPTCVHQTILAGPNTGTLVEEHNGLVTTDPNAYVPFSIAQWIAQRNGHNDRRHGAVLHNINAVSPFSNGNPASGSLNTGFPITREVFDIVPFSKVDPTSATKDPALISLLVGTNSFLCQDAFTLIGYGFAQLGSTTPDQCGSIANTLRAFDPATDPV